MPEKTPRDKELAGRKDSPLVRDLIKTFDEVERGFNAQGSRADAIMDYWDCYNCELGSGQFYNGNSEIYVPIIRNAVNARRTRFVNQIFPNSGRYIDATSTDGSTPRAEVALLEHYIRQTRLRTRVIPALCRNGDVEGQYNLYVDWNETVRHVVSRETRGIKVSSTIGGEQELRAAEGGEDVDDIKEEEIPAACPGVEVLHDTDVLVLPATADSIDEALEHGGSVTIIRRWTKAQINQKAATGEIIQARSDQLIDMMGGDGPGRETVRRDADKAMSEAAGIKGGGKHVLVYETWKKLRVDGKRRLCRAYYGGYDLILGAKLNPFWNDRCPLLSEPLEKIAGSFKGQSPIKAVLSMQWHANDVAMQAADSATFSMMPIVAADPEKNTKALIINLGAVWDIDPNSVKFMEFPKLWQDGMAMIQADTQLIFQTLGVNPAMLPQQTGARGQKRNQAEIALEQQVDVLTTAEACSVLEEGILTPLAERFVEYDHQFREDDIMVAMYGEMGLVAQMEEIPPLQIGTKYQFSWFGVEQARFQQQMQMQIAWLNVARGMEQALTAAGYKLNPAAALEASALNVFGARIGRQVLLDARQQLSVDPEVENQMLMLGHDVPAHPTDNHPAHLKSHTTLEQQSGGDPSGMIRVHIQKHMQMMQMMQLAAAGAAGAGGAPGVPGGAGPGVAGTPQPGAVPAGPRLIKQPPGAINPDQVRGPGVAMPRRM